MMPYRILVTDDNSEYRQNIIELLQFEGFDVVEATNGKEAVEKALTLHPDVILCDVDMPNMDGFAVLAEMKADPSTRNIPFFLITGRGDVESRTRGKTLGVDDYITKPMDVNQLLAKIQQYLDKKDK